MNPQQLEAEVRGLVRRAYPQIDVRIERWSDDPGRTELRTRFAQVLELRDGKIVALRNYDCFYPW